MYWLPGSLAHNLNPNLNRNPIRDDHLETEQWRLRACLKIGVRVAQATRRTEWRKRPEPMDPAFSQSCSPYFRPAGRRQERASRPPYPFLKQALRLRLGREAASEEWSAPGKFSFANPTQLHTYWRTRIHEPIDLT